MNQVQTYPIGPGVTLKSFVDPAFKTMRLSVNMLVPLRAATAAGYALLPSLLGRATREFPDYTALGRKLARLYGASLGSAVSRAGEYQVLTLSAGGISSRYALGGEDMFGELTGLLLSALLQTARACSPRKAFSRKSASSWSKRTRNAATKSSMPTSAATSCFFPAAQPDWTGWAAGRKLGPYAGRR